MKKLFSNENNNELSSLLIINPKIKNPKITPGIPKSRYRSEVAVDPSPIWHHLLGLNMLKNTLLISKFTT